MALTQRINVELRRKQLLEVKMFVIDKITGVSSLVALSDTNINSPQEDEVLQYSGGEWINGPASGTVDPSNFVQGEEPTPAPPVLATAKYTTANNFITTTLQVFLNGMKLLPADLTIYAPNQFSISTLDTIISDVVTVNYFKA